MLSFVGGCEALRILIFELSETVADGRQRVNDYKDKHLVCLGNANFLFRIMGCFKSIALMNN